MTAYTQTVNECFYAYGGASTNLATFTTEDNLLKTYPICKLPDLAQALPNVGAHSSSVKLRALGQAGAAAATTPTYTFTIRALTSTTWSAGGIVLGTSTAAATVSGVTLGIWQLDVDIVLRTLAIPGTSTITVVAGGTLTGSAFSASNNSVPAAGTSPAVTTLDITQQYYLFLSAACSAANASNLINTQLMKLYFEN